MKSRVYGLLMFAFMAALVSAGLVYQDIVLPPSGAVRAPAAMAKPSVESTSVDEIDSLDPKLEWIGLKVATRGVKGLDEAGKVAAAKQAKREAAAERKRKQEAKEQRAREQRQARRQALREARIAYRQSLIITTGGPLGALTFTKTEGVEGNITTAVANIPGRTPQAGWVSSLQTIIKPSPDFVALNEVFNRSTEEIVSLAPAYGVIRGERDDSPGGAGQSLSNVILYRLDTWTPLASGMVKVVNDDRNFYSNQPVLWDRYATWALFLRADGAVVSVISAHMPINPGKYPRQWGQNEYSRVELYARGMDTIRGMADQLSAYGPVLVAGDMNSQAAQGPWTAAQKMALDGYAYTKDSGVMYFFYNGVATLVESRQFNVASDHPGLTTTLAMNGWKPE